MIQMNCSVCVCCSAFKYLLGVNIYQQSLRRYRIAAIRVTLERSRFHPDGCELFP